MEPKRIAAEYIQCPNCKHSVREIDGGYQCSECETRYPIIEGIHVLLPIEMQEPKHAADRLWQTLEMEGVDQPAWKALLHKESQVRILEQALQQFDFSGRVLEIGGGSCWASSLIKLQKPSCEVYATDVSYTALLKGKQVSRLMEADIDYYVVCDAENIPFRDSFFNVAFGCATLHHFPSAIQALKEIHRTLKPGGYYLGWGEPAMSKPLGLVFRTFVTEKIEKQHGILEKTYAYPQWLGFLKKAGFAHYRVEIDREWGYKTDPVLWKMFYYKTFGKLPAPILKFILGSSIVITAEK